MKSRKILSLILLIPKIKQNYEYLAGFYPFYIAKEETELLNEVFGLEVAKTISPGQKKRIINQFRQNIKKTQADIQRKFVEIERILTPLEQIYDKQGITNKRSFQINKKIPLAGQIVLVAAAIGLGAGGGIAILGGMLGIRELGAKLNSLQSEQEISESIRKNSLNVFSWWKVFIETLPVTIYEASEAIDNENQYCMSRDKQIINKLGPKRKQKALNDLHKVIQKKTKIKFVQNFTQLTEENETKIQDLVSDIQKAIDNDISENINSLIETLPVK